MDDNDIVTKKYVDDAIPSIPTSLKNPNALTVKGNDTSSFTYDGSSAKTLNIKAGSNVSITSDTSGNVTINGIDTWRGIQNNLTSTSTSDSLSANQGKILNDKIDNIDIGGRNLVLNTNVELSVTKPGDGAYPIGGSASLFDLSDYCKNNIAINDIFLISVDIKATKSGLNFSPYVRDISKNLTGTRNTMHEATTEWKRYLFGTTITADGSVMIEMVANTTSDSSGETIYMRNLKMESGNKATDWSPAPEDFTDTKVSNELNNNTKAYITGTTSAITNTGTQIFDNGVYLTDTAGGIGAKNIDLGTGTDTGLYILDPIMNTKFAGIMQNGNLWIGATTSTSNHHTGTMYLSSGINASTLDANKLNGSGVSTVYISIPTLTNGSYTHNSYAVLHAGNYLSYVNQVSSRGNNLITLSDDTTTTWSNERFSINHFTTNGLLNGQPSQYGYLLNIGGHSKDIHQLWFPLSYGSLKHRSGNSDGWKNQANGSVTEGDSWSTILDENNVNDYININGRNLILLSNVELSVTKTSDSAFTIGGNAGIFELSDYCKNNIAVGDIYLVSVDIKATKAGMPFRPYLRNSASVSTSVNAPTQQTTTDWTRYTFKVEVASEGTIGINMTANTSTGSSGETYYMRNIKMEKSAISTGWSPAPEDSLSLTEGGTISYNGSVKADLVTINNVNTGGGNALAINNSSKNGCGIYVSCSGAGSSAISAIGEASTSINTGALVINGGVGVSGTINTTNIIAQSIGSNNWTTGSGTYIVADNDGNLVKYSSSRRYKTNFNYDIDKKLYHNNLMDLKILEFSYKESTDIQELGLIAEEVQEINPKLVVTNNDGTVETFKERDIISLLIIEAQTKDKIIEQQSAKLEELSNKVDQLIKRLGE